MTFGASGMTDFELYWGQQLLKMFNTHTPQSRGYVRTKIMDLGELYGLDAIKEEMDRFFERREKIGDVPTWELFANTADKEIMQQHYDAHKAEKKKYEIDSSQDGMQQEFDKRKNEAIKHFGQPTNLEIRRAIYDWMDSYDQYFITKREKLIAEGLLTDETPHFKKFWRMKIIAGATAKPYEAGE